MNKKDNPQVFPTLVDVKNTPSFETEDGMTLLDYFAAKAMQILLSEKAPNMDGFNDMKEVAHESYKMGLAMLEIRSELDV